MPGRFTWDVYNISIYHQDIEFENLHHNHSIASSSSAAAAASSVVSQISRPLTLR